MKEQTHLWSIIVCAITILFYSTYAFAGTWETVNPMGSTYTLLYGINGSKIVGYLGSGQSVIYDGTSWSYFPKRPGAQYTTPTCISGNVIAGGYALPGSYTTHGFTYDGSTWKNYDVPWGSISTGIHGIDGGNLIGQYLDSGSIAHGFLYNGTNWTSLNYPGSMSTTLNGISGNNIVGNWGPGSGPVFGFVYNYNTMTWTPLNFPEAMSTILTSIDGVNIVGTYQDRDFVIHGFLYDGKNWSTLDFPGASRTDITGISGNTIVGSYEAGGYPQGFIYTIPEPATLLLLGLGAAIIRKFKN